MSALPRVAPAARRLALAHAHAPLPRRISALACAVRDDVAAHTHVNALPLDAPTTSPPHADAVVSLLGRDRVGLIQIFSEAAAAANADVVQSRMALLGGDFAIVVHVRLPHHRDAPALEERLRGDFPGFDVAVRHTDPDRAVWRQRWRLWLKGPDRPGIAAAMSAEIEKVGGNVAEMRMKVGGGDVGIEGAVDLEEEGVGGLAHALEEVEQRFGVRIGLVAVPNLVR